MDIKWTDFMIQLQHAWCSLTKLLNYLVGTELSN